MWSYEEVQAIWDYTGRQDIEFSPCRKFLEESVHNLVGHGILILKVDTSRGVRRYVGKPNLSLWNLWFDLIYIWEYPKSKSLELSLLNDLLVGLGFILERC
jgi:hypothetical protein